MQKLTVLYGHPAEVDVFEDYYHNNHLPLAATMKGVEKLELTKLVATPDGSKPAFYRMAQIYFLDMDQLQKTMSSPEGEATAADLSKFATGGVEVMIGSIESE